MFWGTPILSLILGLAPTPRWTIGFPVAVTVLLGIIAILGEDPEDMPGAGLFFTVFFGMVFVGLWLVGRGVGPLTRRLYRWWRRDRV